jgi:hypothetical protein
VIGFAAGFELAMATGLPIFDRYALPVLPLVAMILLRSAARHRHAQPARETRPARFFHLAPIAALVVLGILGVAFTAESASFDGTRWKVAQMAVDAGYTHVQIDAGYEWVGWFRGDGPLNSPSIAVRKRLRASYDRGLCVSIFVDAHKLPPHVIASAWSHALTRRPALFVAFLNGRACSTAPDSSGP